MVCAAVQKNTSVMPVSSAAPGTPFNLYQIPEKDLISFMSLQKDTLHGYIVRPISTTDTTTTGVVDLSATPITSDPARVLASGFPHKGGRPGGHWDMQVSVFQDLPFCADAYTYPGDDGCVYVGKIKGSRDKATIQPYGLLPIDGIAVKAEESKKGSKRMTLHPTTAEHNPRQATILCSRVILDRGSDPSDPTRPGTWEIINHPNYVLQLCYSHQLSCMASTLDGNESPPSTIYQQYEEPQKTRQPESPKRPRSPPTAPPSKRVKA
eukprot:TRINITY_DN12068_c0_g1_i1.p1 TRINITY_DN12068_c0_g1~~TRINITY_DN12068_c0_g1_i1.p1  ORF type:complete len:266 (+),score=-0.70 TRINITY_DN12068_c0_g1_i1:468-1265(+)